MIITSNIKFDISLNGLSLTRIPYSSSSATTSSASSASSLVGAGGGGANTDILLQSLKSGDTIIDVKLETIHSPTLKKNYSLPKVLTAKAVIHVTPAVTVSNSEVVLPFTSIHAVGSHSVLVKSIGGSEQYEWTSVNPAVVSVLTAGVSADESGRVDSEARLISKSLGSAVVIARDHCNPDNHANVSVRVSTPTTLSFLSPNVEIEVDKSKELAIEVKDGEGRSYSNCSGLSLSGTIGEGAASLHAITSLGMTLPFDRCTPYRPLTCDVDFRAVSCQTRCPFTEHPNRNCFILTVKAVSPGFGELLARLKDLAPAPTAAIVLSSYAPIQIFPPTVTLAEGTAVNVSWLGGPLPWPTSAFRTSISHEFEIGVSISSRGIGKDAYTHTSGSTALLSMAVGEDAFTGSVLIKPSITDIHTYRLMCLNVHSQWIEIRVTNSPTPSNPRPVTSTARLKFQCYPRLKLIPPVLSLGVGLEKTVTVHGNHPLTPNVSYWTENPSIATVSANGVVKGIALGETILHGRVKRPLTPAPSHHYPFHPSTSSAGGLSSDEQALKEDGLHDRVLVIVKFDNFVIRAPTTQLLNGHETFVHIEGFNFRDGGSTDPDRAVGTVGGAGVPGDLCFDTVDVEWTTSDTSAITLLPPLITQSLIPPKLLVWTQIVVVSYRRSRS